MGVSANNYATGVGVTTELTVIPCSIAIETAQTDGDFSAIRIRGELVGAGGNAYLGAAIRAEGIVNANTAAMSGLTDAVCAVSSHLIFKTGCTPAAGIYSGLWVNAENIDSTPADLAAIDIYAMHVTMNLIVRVQMTLITLSCLKIRRPVMVPFLQAMPPLLLPGI
jgi:hypothetical protein